MTDTLQVVDEHFTSSVELARALFSSRNRLRALIDAILVLDGRCHVGHKNANRLHARGSACTMVAGTQDVA